jgi:hypothetical protein
MGWAHIPDLGWGGGRTAWHARGQAVPVWASFLALHHPPGGEPMVTARGTTLSAASSGRRR